ncbi:MAG TPA: zinc-dependent metalloprotease [Thermoanaerobaculia bacterium]|nr:zinc-dependent metalloprotease [Thermoanaerobaculia bacterium]
MKRVVYLCLAVSFFWAPVARADEKFEELTRDATVREGFFDTYEKGDHLYLAISADRLGQDLVLVPRLERGIGAAGLFGGLMFDRQAASLVAFERHGDRVFLVKRAHRFTANAGSAEAAALALSIGESVLQSAPVLATRKDGTVLIDVYEWMVSDLSNIDKLLRPALGSPGKPGRATLDRSRSYLSEVKAFPRNLEITARLTFTPGDPSSLTSLPDARFLPLGLHYSFAALPEQPMTPRLGDDRMGYIHTVRKDFSRDEETYYVRYANRWRLEPGEKVGDLYRPKKQIVYYIDRTVPERFRPWVKAGIEEWNRAFEAAGFKDAIRGEMLPDDADPSDLRYATVRWITTDQAGFGGIGPSIVDPRTGEILDAEILIDAGQVPKFKDEWRLLASPATRLDALLGPGAPSSDNGWHGEVAYFADALAVQGSLLRLALAARGEIAPGEPTPDRYLGEAIRYVTMHEVGHTLGLDHNFQGSSSTPLDKVHDRTWTREHGIAASVMDYVPVNLAPLGLENGDFYDVSLGTYDLWVIAYGYTPDPERARQLARLAAQPGHEFGSSDDYYSAGAVDPRNNLWDVSQDPLQWGIERAALLRKIWPRLPELVLADDKSPASLTIAFDAMVSAYSEALAPAIRYIGGQYRHRDHIGDPGARPPFVPVPKQEQRKALAFINEQVFGERAFGVSPELLRQLGGLAWDHWGSPGHFNGRLDFPYLSEISDIQRVFLNRLTDPYRLAWMREAEVKFGAGQVLTLPDLFAGLTESLWSEVWTAPGRDVPALRRDVQRLHLDRMIELLVRPPDRMPADARALARRQLRELHARLSRRLTPPYKFDAYTEAHLQDTRERIETALEAEYRLDPSVTAMSAASSAPAYQKDE